jgi:hypothetical protein
VTPCSLVDKYENLRQPAVFFFFFFFHFEGRKLQNLEKSLDCLEERWLLSQALFHGVG